MASFSLAAGAGTAAGFVVGIIGHEIATARAADAMGDRSGRLTKRTSFSFKAHYDPLGTIVIPAIFTLSALVGAGLAVPPFGWGKRHQLYVRSFRNQRAGAWLISLIGPAWTLLLGVVGSVIFRVALGPCIPGLLRAVPDLAVAAAAFTEVCIYLTIIELLPLPGRDGARIVGLYLSPRAAYKMEELAEYDVLFVIGLMVVLAPVANNLVAPVLRLLLGGACF